MRPGRLDERSSTSIHRLAWNKRQIAALGSASDAQIAELMGVATNTIIKKRRKLGIAPFGQTREAKQHHWTKRQIGWLGKRTDVAIAQQLGIDQTTVAYQRRILGIPSYSVTSKGHEWTEKEIALLGTISDTGAAKKNRALPSSSRDEKARTGN